ncbi:MAG: C25 family peptidase propeptide domain-containing protein, partial [Candidatus Cloacimonadaceae bacterium]
MKRFLIIISLLLIVSGLFAATKITQLSPNQYKVEWEIPAWEMGSQGEFTTLKTSDFGVPAESGMPLLPFDECKIAIPQDGSIQISNISTKSVNIRLEKRLQPVPTITGNSETDAYTYLIDENLYAQTGREPLTVLSQQHFRSLSFVPVRINPFIYDGQYNLQIISGLQFIITIEGNLNLRNSEPVDELTELAARQTINPAQALNWRASERQQVNYADFTKSDFWVRIDTDKDGMFKLTPAQLNMLPVNDIDPRSFRMFTTGGEVHSTLVSYNGPAFREVPIYVQGESDGVFNASDYILFFGRDRDGHEMNQSIGGNLYTNPYSQNVSYWLTFGGSFEGTPRRIVMEPLETTWDETAVTTPAIERIETENYQRIPVGFEWFMGRFFGNSTAEYSYQIELEDLDTTQQQTLSLLLKQEYIRTGSDIEHKVRLKVNGVQLLNLGGTVQEWAWVGLSPITITHTGQYFAPGNNDLLINVIRYRADNLFLDYYQVAYQKKLIKRSKQFAVSIPNTFSNQKVRYDFTGSSSGIRIFKTLAGTDAYDVSELSPSAVSGGFNFIGRGTPSVKYYAVQDADLYTPASIQSVQPVNLAVSNQSLDNIIITPSEYLQQANSLAAFYNQNFNKRSKVV